MKESCPSKEVQASGVADPGGLERLDPLHLSKRHISEVTLKNVGLSNEAAVRKWCQGGCVCRNMQEFLAAQRFELRQWSQVSSKRHDHGKRIIIK